MIRIPKDYDGYCYASNSYSDSNQFSTLIIENKQNSKKSSQRYYQSDNEVIKEIDNDINLLNEGILGELHFKRAFLSVLYEFINKNGEIVEALFLGKSSYNNDFFIEINNEKYNIDDYRRRD